ncbi:MAG: hypothetical protein AVDCRST_MAG53-31, partial [uncultured Solirubrobacteraceae bacterium]
CSAPSSHSSPAPRVFASAMRRRSVSSPPPHAPSTSRPKPTARTTPSAGTTRSLLTASSLLR